MSFDKDFTIDVSNVNETPTDITLTLDNSKVAENQAAGTAVGTLSTTDPDAPKTAQTFTYTLVSGDIASFKIVDDKLVTNAEFNYEAKDSYTVTVRTTDQGNILYCEKDFTINVADVNEGPTDIALSATSIAEDKASGSEIGTLSTTDQDSGAGGVGDVHTYTLPVGIGDNVYFSINGTSLKTAIPLDYETTKSYSVTVRTTDQGGLYYEKVILIIVTNVNEKPTDITLSNSTIAENAAIGTPIGLLTATDQDAGDSHTFTLVTGTGSTHNSYFKIVGTQLQVNKALDYESKPKMYIRVKAEDAGHLTYEKALTITVTNVNESPYDIQLSHSVVAANEPSGTVIDNLSTSDPDFGDSFTYSFVDDANYPDNLLFTLSDNVLKTGQIFNYNDGTSYTVKLRTTDFGLLNYEKIFIITISQPHFQQPDLQIKGQNDAAFKGEGIWNDDVNQTSTANALTTNPYTATYHILLNNTGTYPDTFALNGPAGENGWTVQYFTEGGSPEEITTDVTSANGYSVNVTTPLNTASTTAIMVRVTAAHTVKGGNSFEAAITAVSSKNVDATDTVIATTTKLPIQSVTITSPAASTMMATTQVTFTASVVGDLPVQYKFMDGNNMLRDFAISNTYTWTSTAGNHTIKAVAREIGTTTEVVSNGLTYNVIATLSAATMTSSLLNATSVGVPVTLTAAATGGSTNLRYKFMAGTSLIRSFSSSNTYTFTPTVAKTYSFTVVVSDASGIDPNATVTSPAVNLVIKPALSAVSLTTSPLNAVLSGFPVTLTAAATGGVNVQYKFMDGTTQLRGYEAGNTFTFTPTAARVYSFTVVAKDLGGVDINATKTSSAVSFTVKPALTTVSVTTLPLNAVTVGVPVVITATTDGGANVQYQFMTGTTILKSFSSSNTLSLTPTVVKTYSITVIAKDLGGVNPAATVTSTPAVTLAVKPALTAVTIVTTPSIGSMLGVPVTLTATATGGAYVQYKFMDGTTMLRDFAPGNTFTYTPSEARAYTFTVIACDLNSLTPGATVTSNVSFNIKAPLSAATVVTDPVGSVMINTPVTLTATATGGANLQYQFMAGTTKLRSFSSSNTFTFTTPGVAKTYIITVIVKDLGGLDPTATVTSPAVTLQVKTTP